MITRKFILLLLVLAILAGIFVVIQSFESRRTPGWQSELVRYLLFSERSLAEVRIIAAVKAASPQNFVPDLVIAVPTDWTWQGISEIPPPTAIQCVRLEDHVSFQDILEGQRGWEIVLIGYHDDGLWHAGWLVHEIYGDVGIQELHEMLAKLGCDLGLDSRQALTGMFKLYASVNRFPLAV